MKFSQYLPAIAGLCATVFAQTFTSCDPLNSTCPADTALGNKNYTIDFVDYEMSSTVWNATAGQVAYGDNGAEFIINERGDSPTVQTNFYIFFGTVEVIFQAASGQGIVSSIVIESNDLDEIDWEWIGGNHTHVQTNYFGKGNTTTYDRARWHPVNDPQANFHNYTTHWTPESIEFYIDGNIVRTLLYADANGGSNYPQTPSNVRLGIWAGGDPKNDKYTIEWAGGEVDYNDAPFTMTVQSVRISDYTTGATQYQYEGHSGSYQSIKLLNTTAPIKLDGPNGESVTKRWAGLSTTTKIAIGATIGGVALLIAAVFIFCCVKQRRVGKHEKLLEDAKFEKDRAELMAFRAEMSRQRNEKMAYMSSTPVGGMYSNISMQPLVHGNGRGYQRY